MIGVELAAVRQRRWTGPFAATVMIHAAALVACLWLLEIKPNADSPPHRLQVPIRVLLRPPIKAANGGAAAGPRTHSALKRHRRISKRPAISRAPIAPGIETIEQAATDDGAAQGSGDTTGDGSGTGAGSGSGAGAGSVKTEIAPISAIDASHLRIYQVLPALPLALEIRGKRYRVVTRVCITDKGVVESVELKEGAVAELDAMVIADQRTWRYRPRIVKGVPTPFCHPMSVIFVVDE